MPAGWTREEWDEYLEGLAREAQAARLIEDAAVKKLAALSKNPNKGMEPPVSVRRAITEQAANLLRYSEFPLVEIARRVGRTPSAIRELQMRKRISRPVTVRGKYGYDVFERRALLSKEG